MSEQPGDGGQGYSWFAIELTSDPVEEPVPFPVHPPAPPPAQVYGGPESGFFAPVLPEPFEFRFKARVAGPRVEPIQMSVSARALMTRAFEVVVPGTTSSVKQVAFYFDGQRDPAYIWTRALRDDDEILTILAGG